MARLPNTFQLEAATKDKTTCGLTPANWAPLPLPTGFELYGCIESQTQMLGSRCEIRYESACKGWMDFGLYQPLGVVVDWNSPRIDNLLFRVRDTPDCLEIGRTQCLDEYHVVLDRM